MEKAKREYPKYVPVEVHAKPIQGGFGTTVNPGDTVAMVRSGYGNHVGCDTGTYVGYIVSKPTGNLRARVAIQQTNNVFHWPDGRPFDWSRDYDRMTHDSIRPLLVIKEVTRTVHVTLNLNRIVTIK